MSLSRLLALIPVIFLLLDAAASFIYGTDIMVRSLTGLLGEPAQIGGRLGVFLVVMDTFLVGATLMVAAFGFYELFIVRTPGRRYRLPRWLRMHDLEDLKARVTSMLILVVAITFVDRTVESHDEQEVLFLGLGISIIIVALTLFLWFGKRSGPAGRDPDPVGVTGGAGPAGGGGPAAGGGRAGAGEVSSSGAAGSNVHSPPEGSAAAARSAPALRLATAADVPAEGGSADWARSAAASGGGAVSGREATSGGASTSGGGAASGRSGRVAAILGVARQDGGWTSPAGTALAVAGYARVDLRAVDLAGPEFRVRAHAVLGMVSIVVPSGTRVAESGVAVLGLRLGRGGGAAAGEVRRRVSLSGLCVLGVVRVRRDGSGPPGAVELPPSAPATIAPAPARTPAPDRAIGRP